jgi:hypothetical protein
MLATCASSQECVTFAKVRQPSNNGLELTRSAMASNAALAAQPGVGRTYEQSNKIVMEQLVAGPFLLAKASGKVPEGVLTVSACLADIVPDTWAIEWVKADEPDRLARAAQFGIDAHHLPDAIRWATDHLDGGGFAWPNLFLDASAARDFCRRFVTANVRLLQMSLPGPSLESFLILTTPPPQQPGYAPVGSVGVHEALARRLPLGDLAEQRGYEVLGFDGAAGFDSFRCNGLEGDFERLLGVQFNRWGLIDDGSAAARCADYANGPEVPTCAVAWHPWLVVEHAL